MRTGFVRAPSQESLRRVASGSSPRPIAQVVRRRLAWALAPVVIVAAAVAGICWWLTEPLDAPLPPAQLVHLAARPAPPAQQPVESSQPSLSWPEDRLEGIAAKRRLLDILISVGNRLESVDGYTALFHKQERIDGMLGDEQTMEMKVRHHPFAVYFKFTGPQSGKEVVYAQGLHDNKLIAHSSGWSRRLLPRLAVPPTHALALADNRHPITEAGLANLIRKLIGFRRMDLLDPEAVTILDRTTGSDGRIFLRSIHTHPHKRPERPFARVEVLYDPETEIPIQITNYDWPDPGEPSSLLIAEHYAYDQLKLNVVLRDLDFDPANPAYAFHR